MPFILLYLEQILYFPSLLNACPKTLPFVAQLPLLYMSMHVHEVKQCIHFDFILVIDTVSYSAGSKQRTEISYQQKWSNQ